MKAILWDNDGVLVDTEWLYFEATRDALAELGVALSEAQYVELSLRRGGSCFDLAAARGVDRARIDAVRRARNDAYAARLDAVPLISGVREALAALQPSFRMAIVTSSRPEHFARTHARSGILGHFELVLTRADYTRSKPDPEPYLLGASRLGVAPRDCLVVEDSERGLTAARGAGMACVVVPRGLSRGGDFTGALRVLEHAGEIVPLARELARGALKGGARLA